MQQHEGNLQSPFVLLVKEISGPQDVERRQPMSLTSRELWTVLHGLVFGSLFLLAFAGGLAGLYSSGQSG
jgi:hypothetical protein